MEIPSEGMREDRYANFGSNRRRFEVVPQKY